MLLYWRLFLLLGATLLRPEVSLDSTVCVSANGAYYEIPLRYWPDERARILASPPATYWAVIVVDEDNYQGDIFLEGDAYAGTGNP